MVYRVLTWTVLVAGFVFAATVLSLRYWVLPGIGQHRHAIEQKLSALAHQRVTIGGIAANWDGLRPTLELQNVVVFDQAGRPALTFAEVKNTLSWLSLVVLEPRFRTIEIIRPTAAVRRSRDGIISIGGPQAEGHGGDGGFADWLLRQREIVVRDATISWHDEARAAPPLALTHVMIVSRNRFGRHRFRLRATPPPELAAPIDVRGDLIFGSIRSIMAADGELYAELGAADIARLGDWLPYPVAVPRAAGAARVWANLSDGRVVTGVADVRLEDVETRLAADLPRLELISLAGRVRWQSDATRFKVSATNLGFTTGTGLTLTPVDFTLQLVRPDAGGPGRGEIRADALALEPLVKLADRLPLPAKARKALATFSPKGHLFDITAHWTGPLNDPVEYGVQGRFEGVGVNRSEGVPGFAGLAGSIDGNEQSGKLNLDSSGVTVDLPRVFRDAVHLDTLRGTLGWTRPGGEIAFTLDNVAFSNAHLAGTLFGTYRTAAGGPGSADLTGALTRADARFVKNYLPVTIDGRARKWLDNAFVAGKASDVSLRLKGDLAHFPFAGDRDGIFSVTAKVSGGVLNYGPHWPHIENIQGELAFRGERMDIDAQEASMLGVRLTRVAAEIPHLKGDDEVVRIKGEGEGTTAAFLAFIKQSPVLDAIDPMIDDVRVSGRGRLHLALELPLHDLDRRKITGSYQFIDNRIVARAGVPPLEQVNGRLEFTESRVRVPRATGRFLGGPVTVSAAGERAAPGERAAAVNLRIEGRADMDNLRREAGSPRWAQALSGATDWEGTFVLRKQAAEFAVESDLLGIASDLPAPFGKSASQAVPLRFERQMSGGSARIRFTYGNVVSARFLLDGNAANPSIARGTIKFGGRAPEPTRDGIWVMGALKRFDVSGWRDAGGPGAPHDVPLSGINVKIGELDMLGRRFGDVSVHATKHEGIWRSNLAAREFEGAVTWRPEGRGKITARLDRLVIPPAAGDSPRQQPENAPAQWPALDVRVEQFQYHDQVLGQLALRAAPGKDQWNIEQLRITNPDGELLVDGVWRTGRARPNTQINVRLAVKDIGRMLVRLGHPAGVKRGTARVEGSLSWPGGPRAFAYPVLSGHLTLKAVKGQFVKLEPGIGKLLGILSLQSLPRRITLDFRDVFSEGFAFDEITGAFDVRQGVANTDGLRMIGPAARVLMTGEVDLARETQRLDVKIVPSLSDSVSIAGALIGGPVAGVAAFLAQKVLKDPFGQMASYEYRVTGSWGDPQVSKVPRAPVAAEGADKGQ